ncbi:hypothetical protein EXU85_29320 [Spirosoma sp. KCTC 42546]|uniref:hypothetical protein n=1 Tax=Spirosoma sp. KCTC 42546 TaxID=2520506 RepID=UPI00115C281E|nr:hypothetical protein [Spirosoma sp. KCTC 42546]QDK82486.1 hypothetical protein EXU85_29320 [Spirosoma sp. KCTC 42546]
MLIANDTSVHVFDENNWVIHSAKGRNFLINQATYQLYQILRESSDWLEAVRRFNQIFGLTLNQQEFNDIVAQTLGGYNVLIEDQTPVKPSLKNNYLKLKVELLPACVVGVLSKPLQWVYALNVFWIAFLLCSLVVPMVYFVSDANQIIAQTDYVLYFSLLYATMLVHELGHIGACAKYGLKHGGVGFGFYFIMPVMYADITEVWLVDRSHRVIANLAGIFNEILYASALAVVYLMTGNETCLAVALSVFTMVIWEFNPFVRFDGYWVLSDLTNTPNLLQKANEMFRISIRRVTLMTFWQQPKTQLRKLSWQKIGLFIYGFINTLLWVAIMIYTLIMYREIVFQFPVIVWQLFAKAVNAQLSWQDLSRQYITVLLFYVVFLKFIISQWQSNKHILLKNIRKNYVSEESITENRL